MVGLRLLTHVLGQQSVVFGHTFRLTIYGMSGPTCAPKMHGIQLFFYLRETDNTSQPQIMCVFVSKL